MRQYIDNRHGFTLLEVIFVIVILGIVSSIGAEVIAQVYESYIIQRAQYKANIKTELALNQIANRLRYAIPSTVGTRKTRGSSFVGMDVVTDPNMNVLQWVGADGDSFEAIRSNSNRRPGWSGVCDVAASTSTSIATPGSNLDLATTIISKLGGDIANAQLFFPGSNQSYGVSGGSGETITMNPIIPSGTLIQERYKLAWSSYALEVYNKNLLLHYNFSATPKANITNQQTQILLRNVTNFRFKYSGGAFRIKICKEERISFDSNETISACKERVVF